METKPEILSQWQERMLTEIPAARNLEYPLLVDTVPIFLDNLAEALGEKSEKNSAVQSSSVAQEHGGERARLTRYSPDHLIREYQILKAVVVELLNRHGPPDERARRIVDLSFDDAVCQAMTAFFLVHSRIREQFVASLTHDLRNPLGAIKMAAEMIGNLLGDPQPPGVVPLTQKIINGVRRLDRMIQDLLDTNLIQLGERIEVRLAPCDMLECARQALSDLPATNQKRVRLSGASVLGHWDAEALRRAIENMVTNAFKYGSSERDVTVTISNATPGRVLVKVHNFGDPIPAQEQELLFQPFRRSSNAKVSGKQGWGLGLALVRGVAEAHAGSVGIESSAETGTIFMIDIPVDPRPHVGPKP